MEIEKQINAALTTLELLQMELDKAVDLLREIDIKTRDVQTDRLQEALKKSLRLRVLVLAATQIGVKESYSGSNKEIEKYHAFASKDNTETMRDEIPWCSSFLCWVIETAGAHSTNSRAARSWLNWQKPAPLNDPLPGDICVFWREHPTKSWKGHCGIFIAEDPKTKAVLCLGGNQSDSVNLTWYQRYLKGVDRVLGFRRTDFFHTLSPENEDIIREVADDLVENGQLTIGHGGSWK